MQPRGRVPRGTFSSQTMFIRIIFLVLFLLGQCSRPVSAVQPGAAPELACQFETVFESRLQSQPSFKAVWRLWRASEEVESWQIGSKEGELTALDGAGEVQFRRIFHPERTEVFYSTMELKVLGKTRDWAQSYSLVAPAFLKEKLSATGTEVMFDASLEKYEGTVDGRKWVVLWSPQDQLAYQLRVESERGTSTTTLLERHLLDKQPWERLRKRGYHSIDFADLGDSETNPVIRRIMNRLGISCSHKSCGGICLPPQ
jgi:hypothetical protein